MAEATSPRPGLGPDDEQWGGAFHRTGDSTEASRGLAPFDDWAEQLRTDAASQLRRREQWLRRQAADDASMVGVLVDHAERGSTLAITTSSGNRHVGRVRGAGAELVVLDITGARVAIDLGCIETIRRLEGDDQRPVDPVGHRSGADLTGMAEVLAMAVADRPDVTLVTRSGEYVSGELLAVGRDVVMVRPPDGGPIVYSSLASVSESLLPPSTVSG